MVAPRRQTGSRPAHPLPEGFEREREITPIHGVSLDEALIARSPAAAAALADSGASPGGIPLWAKIAGVPATVLLLAGLLVANQQRSDAMLKEARADARQDRAEFRAAIDKLATAVEANTSAVKDLARQSERDRDREPVRRGKER